MHDVFLQSWQQLMTIPKVKSLIKVAKEQPNSNIASLCTRLINYLATAVQRLIKALVSLMNQFFKTFACKRGWTHQV